jgi:hypothetical protein
VCSGFERLMRSPWQPVRAIRWAAHILPIDPHDADRVLDLVRKNQIRLMPAAPSPV